MNLSTWTPSQLAGGLALLIIAAAMLAWVSVDPHNAQAWAILGQVVQAAGQMVLK